MATHVNALGKTEEYKVVAEYVRNLYAGDVLHESGYGITQSVYASQKCGKNHAYVALRLPDGTETSRRYCLNTRVNVRRPV